MKAVDTATTEEELGFIDFVRKQEAWLEHAAHELEYGNLSPEERWVYTYHVAREGAMKSDMELQKMEMRKARNEMRLLKKEAQMEIQRREAEAQRAEAEARRAEAEALKLESAAKKLLLTNKFSEVEIADLLSMPLEKVLQIKSSTTTKK